MTNGRIKRPAYQWYPAQANSDEVFRLMTYEQQGVYRALLDHQWAEGSIPSDVAQIAALLPKIALERFREIWPLIAAKFRALGSDRLINGRLDSQRHELDKYIRLQKQKSRKGVLARQLQAQKLQPAGSPEPSRGLTSSSSTSSSTSSKNVRTKNVSSATSAEPAIGGSARGFSEARDRDESLTVLEFPIVGTKGTTWALTERQVAAWQSAFPSLDILAEARHALAWLQANPGRRKTTNGMPKFLVNWFGRTTDRSPRAQPAPAGSLSQARNGFVDSLGVWRKR